MPQMFRTVLLAVVLALSGGCVKHVQITSDPPGAMVRKGRRSLGTTPIEITVLAVPLLRQPVHVGLAGYRGQDINIGRDLGLWRRRTTHEVILIRAHGPSGTWGPDDAGSQ